MDDLQIKKKRLLEIVNRVKKKGSIDLADLIEVENEFGYSPRKIIEELQKRKAKKNIFKPSGYVVHSYVGKEEEYLIFPDVLYCSCLSKYPSNIFRRRYCHHIICYLLSEALGLTQTYYLDDELFEKIYLELL